MNKPQGAKKEFSRAIMDAIAVLAKRRGEIDQNSPKTQSNSNRETQADKARPVARYNWCRLTNHMVGGEGAGPGF